MNQLISFHQKFMSRPQKNTFVSFSLANWNVAAATKWRNKKIKSHLSHDWAKKHWSQHSLFSDSFFVFFDSLLVDCIYYFFASIHTRRIVLNIHLKEQHTNIRKRKPKKMKKLLTLKRVFKFPKSKKSTFIFFMLSRTDDLFSCLLCLVCNFYSACRFVFASL